ncbi:hypothetical protein GOP47_0012137 [Adiantum capillus-veneris]|uniref:Uncharacterized protein n=1 Tax=Adiantum capillus-veneris TaxID=13818 RepID=A0A9D4UQU6_ADICA|nr:hypothetical protein GOP47_0012137 [Adiantum capillus-veneris]
MTATWQEKPTRSLSDSCRRLPACSGYHEGGHVSLVICPHKSDRGLWVLVKLFIAAAAAAAAAAHIRLNSTTILNPYQAPARLGHGKGRCARECCCN